MGAPWEIYSLADLPRLDTSRFRMIVLPNLFALTEEKRAWLNEKVFAGDRHIVFGHAPGIITGGRFDPALLSFPVNNLAGSEPASDIRDWEAVAAWADGLARMLAHG